jgi:hypothetical protein
MSCSHFKFAAILEKTTQEERIERDEIVFLLYRPQFRCGIPGESIDC